MMHEVLHYWVVGEVGGVYTDTPFVRCESFITHRHTHTNKKVGV